MSVPPEIRKVERPVNTTVYDSKKEGPKRYFVRERIGCKHVKGKCPQPIYGKVIGYIYEGKYISKTSSVSVAEPDCLSFGSAVFAYSVCSTIKQQLLETFSLDDALTILGIALLRVLNPNLSDGRLNSRYEKSWLSVSLPGLHLSANTVSKFILALGRDGTKRKAFFERRLRSVTGFHHIAIDGTLKQDSSEVNDLSGFFYKSRLKGCRDISVLYAFNVEEMEPLCAQVFPGNCIDAAAYREFITENKIEKGIIIADKGFPPSQIAKELKAHPQLHFLTPVKRNNINIKKLGLLDFDGTFQGVHSQILYSKRKSGSGRYYYAFQDTGLEQAEQKDYLTRRVRHKDFDNENFRQKKEKFGLIVFESDQDLEAELAYRCYQQRWLLELMFKKYKSVEGLNDTRVQSDHSVYGSEFINFVATVITCEMIKKAENAQILKDITYGEMMHELALIWRKTKAPQVAKSDDEYWVHPFNTGMNMLIKLGLVVEAEEEKIERPKTKGRPRIKPVFVGPKRPRGRPRKTEATEE